MNKRLIRFSADGGTGLSACLQEILEASIDITGADYGNIQMINKEGSGLEIVAEKGLGTLFLEHFRFVPLKHSTSACGRAAETGMRVMIEDVESDLTYKEHLETARSVPFRAVQSTPLFGRNGKLIGVLSTHFIEPRLPDERYLHILDLYALQAAHVIELINNQKANQPELVKVNTGTNISVDSGAPIDGTQSSTSIIWTLPFFSDLNESEKAEILKAARFKHLHKGEMLYWSGDPVSHLFCMCIGAVQVFSETPDGHELTSAINIVGDVLYDPNSDKQTHAQNARAVMNSTLLMIPMSWVEGHIKSWDHLANKFINLMAKQVHEARLEVEHQATFNAAQIIACFLQHICVLHSFDPGGFILPYTKSLIASRLGMELESFSRALPRLRDLGIMVSGKRVSFTDIALTQKFSCGSCSAIEECPIHKAMQRLMEGSTTAKKLEVF